MSYERKATFYQFQWNHLEQSRDIYIHFGISCTLAVYISPFFLLFAFRGSVVIAFALNAANRQCERVRARTSAFIRWLVYLQVHPWDDVDDDHCDGEEATKRNARYVQSKKVNTRVSEKKKKKKQKKLSTQA